MSRSSPSLDLYSCETAAADGAPRSITGLLQAYTCLYASYVQSYSGLDQNFLRPVVLVCGSGTALGLMRQYEPVEMN